MARLGMLSVDLLFVQVEEDLDLLSFLTSLSKELVFGHILAYFLDKVGVFWEMAVLWIDLNRAVQELFLKFDGSTWLQFYRFGHLTSPADCAMLLDVYLLFYLIKCEAFGMFRVRCQDLEILGLLQLY